MNGLERFMWWRREEDDRSLDKRVLLDDIRKAHTDWVVAQARLDWVVQKDQIDYAIYALEAAEKRYEMLLRLAKELTWDEASAARVHALTPVPLRKEG